MKKRILTYLLLAICSILPMTAKGGKVPFEVSDTIKARDVFVDLPANVLNLLKKSTRISMLHYFDADSIWKAPNAMEGVSELITVRPDYLKVRITDVSTLQIKLLPFRSGQLVMTIYNIGKEPGGDSDIRFYNSELQEIPSDKFIKMPQLKDFFDIPKGSLTTMKEIQGMLPFYTTIFNADADSTTLEAEITVGEYVSTDDYNILKLFMRPRLKYTWNGKKFTS